MALLTGHLTMKFGGLVAVNDFDLSWKRARSSASSARTAQARRPSST